MVNKWMQRGIKHPNRVHKYLDRKYGDKAFYDNGEIKISYIKKAITELKNRPVSQRPKGLLNALYLALRLKRNKK